MRARVICSAYAHDHVSNCGWGNAAMDSQKAVCVEVDGSRTIVQGLDSETTAKDVISALRLSREMLPGPFVLLEVWKGCCRRVEKEERICSLLEQWGNESRNVRLVVMSSYQYNKKRRGAEQSTALYRAQTHGKVATRRRRIRQRKLKTKRTLATEVQGMLETLKVKREELLDLTTAKQQNPTKEVATPSWVGGARRNAIRHMPQHFLLLWKYTSGE